MSSIRIEASGPLGGYLAPPPSKNYSTRYILCAVLAEGQSVIRRPATNDDARALVACGRMLGAEIHEENGDLRIRGVAGRPRNPGRLNPGNAGAVLRLLLGVTCLIEGEVEFVTEHAESLGKRPNEDLLRALRELGAEARGTGSEGRLPIVINGGRQRVRGGGEVAVSGAKSSQYLSALLYLLPHLERPTAVRVCGERMEDPPLLVSRPLIDQTLEVLRAFGLRVEAAPDLLSFNVAGGQCGQALEGAVNADWPSAAALLACVAVAGGMATLYGLREDTQGERRAEEYLTRLGCIFTRPREGELVVHSRGSCGRRT